MFIRWFQRFDWIVAGVFCVLLGSIMWSIQQGPRGFGYQDQLLAKQRGLQDVVANLQLRNAKFEARVKLLRPESVDPDLVDELARRDLAMAHPNDRFVLLSR
jgi:cell division protein FtsB